MEIFLFNQDEQFILSDNNNPHSNLTKPDDRFYLEKIKLIRLILPWLILIFGLFGNFFILSIFLKKQRRQTSNGFCFSALALSDICALIFMLMRSMLKLKIVHNVTLTCKLIKFIYYASLEISSWCLVLLTLDRLIAVCFIFKYSDWNRKLNAFKLLIFLIILITMCNLHLLIYVESKELFVVKTEMLKNSSVVETMSVFICNVDEAKYPVYFKYVYTKWDIYHAVIYGLLPFLVILTANVMIILKLTLLNRVNFFLNVTTTVNRSNSINSVIERFDPSFKPLQINVMLLTVAFVFLLLTSPISVYMIFFYEGLSMLSLTKREFVKVVLTYIGYLNNSIHFYICLSLSNEFRREFLLTVRNCRFCTVRSKRNNANNEIETKRVNSPLIKQKFNDETKMNNRKMNPNLINKKHFSNEEITQL